MGGQRHPGSVDRLIAALAERQHGVVSRVQLLNAGLTRRHLERRLQAGRLHLVHRGVYAVGHRLLSREGRWLAAVLASGDGAVLSHRSAAAAWGLRETARVRVEVTVGRVLRHREGLETHHARLAADEVTVLRAIPVTTAARTLLDLAAVVPADQLARAVERAERLRLADAVPLPALLARHPRCRGARALRAALVTAPPPTRSELEDRFLAFAALAGLPRPEVNGLVELRGVRIEADFVWRRERVVVELDGFATHGTHAAFERDRARDRRLQAMGWAAVRVTWAQLHAEPEGLAAELRMLLALRAS